MGESYFRVGCGKKHGRMERIHGCILSFTSKCMETVVFRYPSDEDRIQKLRREHKLICGVADGLACNSLCDSLLQVFIANKLVTVPVESNTSHISVAEWRRAMCAIVRQYLYKHDDMTFRPEARDLVNEVKETSTNDHEWAFLEPHQHAKSIFEFCIDKIGNPDVLTARGCRLIIFSRFDEDMNPQ